MLRHWQTICLLTASLSLSHLATADTANASVPLEELRQFSEVFHQIRQNYVSDVSDEELIRLAIEGMLSGLDPHSEFLDKRDFNDLKESTSGEFAGIGIEVILDKGFIRVIAPIDDTPAQRGGILAGDLIVKIDEHTVQDSDLNTSVNLLRGKKGSKVRISIIREKQSKPLIFNLKREIITIQSVKTRWLEEGFAYLRIAQFQDNSPADARLQLAALLKDKQSRGLVIDLRDNPGGILQSSVEIADLFLDHGLIVYTQGRNADSKEEFIATADSIFKNKPIVVLMNTGSASASEILAGALQDHKRAIIVGTNSFGKGSVQTILPLPNDNAIKLTTALYYTPNGRSIQALGIKPDIEIPMAKLTINDSSQELNITEASLANHLPGSDEKTGKVKSGKPLAFDDYQLHEALNVLKAMALQKNRD